MKVFFKALSLWFGIFIIAFINGAIRELVIKLSSLVLVWIALHYMFLTGRLPLRIQ